MLGPGWVAQLVRASSRYTKVEGSISGQGTYKKQSINKWNIQINTSLPALVITWMDLENIMLIKIRQSEKAKNDVISLTCEI